MKMIKKQIWTTTTVGIVAMLGMPTMASATKGAPLVCQEFFSCLLVSGALLVTAAWPVLLVAAGALAGAYLLYKVYVIDDLQKSEMGDASSSAGGATRALDIPEGYTFSMREAAQAIGVTRGTLQGYITSGRIRTNSDKSIDAAALLRAGFIIRTFPPRRA
jgi:hypothetical protein